MIQHIPTLSSIRLVNPVISSRYVGCLLKPIYCEPETFKTDYLDTSNDFINNYSLNNNLIPEEGIVYVDRLDNYIKNNVLTAFVLFTILNECCKYIMLYHNIYNCAIGDTRVEKFTLYEHNHCIINTPHREIIECKNELNKTSIYNDYMMFLGTFYTIIQYNNSHFIDIYKLFCTKIMKNNSL